jgi:hypothetical protein
MTDVIGRIWVVGIFKLFGSYNTKDLLSWMKNILRFIKQKLMTPNSTPKLVNPKISTTKEGIRTGLRSTQMKKPPQTEIMEKILDWLKKRDAKQ